MGWYDRNITSFLCATTTVYHLYTNQINLALLIIGILDFIDVLVGTNIDYALHHTANVLGCIYWNTMDTQNQYLATPAVWYLLLHEVSTIPYTLIYLLKPIPGYKKYLELPLKIWFATSFIIIRSYSLYYAYQSIQTAYIVFYCIIGVLGTLDVYWGIKIIIKIRKTINLST